MRQENARTRSRIISLSLPLEQVAHLSELAQAQGVRLGTMAAMLITRGLGDDPASLRRPGNPRTKRVPTWEEAYNELVKQFGENAPSKQSVREMFGGIQTYSNFEQDMQEKGEMIERSLGEADNGHS